MKNWFLPILSLLILLFAVPVMSAELAPGLVAYYRFESESGGVTPDNSGSNDCTPSGASLTTGQSGQAYVFAAGVEQLDCGATIGDYTDNFTIFARIKPTAVNGRIISRRNAGGGLTQYDWFVRSGGLQRLFTGDNFTGSVDLITDTLWHHVRLVINGASSQFYVDGAADGAAFNPTITSRSVNTIIGNLEDLAGDYVGLIDEILIYNRAVPEGEGRQIEMGFLHGGM